MNEQRIRAAVESLQLVLDSIDAASKNSNTDEDAKSLEALLVGIRSFTAARAR